MANLNVRDHLKEKTQGVAIIHMSLMGYTPATYLDQGISKDIAVRNVNFITIGYALIEDLFRMCLRSPHRTLIQVTRRVTPMATQLMVLSCKMKELSIFDFKLF